MFTTCTRVWSGAKVVLLVYLLWTWGKNNIFKLLYIFWNVRNRLFHIHFRAVTNWVLNVSCINSNIMLYWWTWLKVAENSFQYFSRLRVWWVIITTLYLLTSTSWYQQTAQSSGNKLPLILWHNRLP